MRPQNDFLLSLFKSLSKIYVEITTIIRWEKNINRNVVIFNDATKLICPITINRMQDLYFVREKTMLSSFNEVRIRR